MKRGGTLRRHVRLARVSAKVTRARPEWDAVYRLVDERSRGRCEVWLTDGLGTPGAYSHHLGLWRCLARAGEHHHTRKPRRSFHAPEWIIHLCARHHAQCSASYQVGRLLISPLGDGAFTCQVVQKAGKWA